MQIKGKLHQYLLSLETNVCNRIDKNCCNIKDGTLYIYIGSSRLMIGVVQYNENI